MRGEISPELLLHVGRIPGLTGITVDGGVRIGALTTHLEVGRHPAVRAEAPALAEACLTVGGWQTQAVRVSKRILPLTAWQEKRCRRTRSFWPRRIFW